MAVESTRVHGESEEADRFVDRCAASLEALYAADLGLSGRADPWAVYAGSVRYMLRMLAVLVVSEQMPAQRKAAEPLRDAARAVTQAAMHPDPGLAKVYDERCRAAFAAAGLAIFAPADAARPRLPLLIEAAQGLLRERPDAPMEPIFFETVPLYWLGRAYQGMLALRPSSNGEKLTPAATRRKKGGVYYTPPCLVSYVVESVLPRTVENGHAQLPGPPSARRLADLRVLDPAMGSGDFLSATVDFLSESAGMDLADEAQRLRAEIAANCVYGLDVDPAVVDLARFCVWAASGYADGTADSISSHLICANALGGDTGQSFDWAEAFPAADQPGFDAVIGNPPYIASKNGLAPGPAGRGQSDSYLLFLSTAIERGLVKPGGMLSMVLPDPFLVRGNAAEVRRKLIADWTIESLLHISDAFPDAVVANVVPVCRNAPAVEPTFPVARIERTGDRRDFALRPLETARAVSRPVRRDTALAQPRCELLYLLEDGPFGETIRMMHGESLCLAEYRAPFAPLRALNVKTIFRGEEVGKAAISQETGDLPMLLGGQSVQPYEITWEGRRIDRSRVKKPVDRYLSTKVLIQKSSSRLIAALDKASRRHRGYVFPQSVYAVGLRKPGMSELYLLCILNSEVMNEYIRRAVTGYKLLQPQLEIEDIRALPIRRVSFTTPLVDRRSGLVRAISIFRDESSRAAGAVAFPRLSNYVVECLTSNPERSDVVHDLLVRLGGTVARLTLAGRKRPDAQTTRRCEAARRAIEAIVWRLYSSQPAQMELPW